jgi:hypothetical protein
MFPIGTRDRVGARTGAGFYRAGAFLPPVKDRGSGKNKAQGLYGPGTRVGACSVWYTVRRTVHQSRVFNFIEQGRILDKMVARLGFEPRQGGDAPRTG